MDLFSICALLFLVGMGIVSFIFYRSDNRPSSEIRSTSHLEYAKPIVWDEEQPKPASSAHAAPVTPKRTFFLQIHGIKFRNSDGSLRQEILRRCKLKEMLLLVPEPDNPVSPFAIKVCRENGECIGYVPSERSASMLNQMSIGWTYAASVGELWHDGNTTGCLMRIDVITMSYRTEARLAKKQAASAGS
jgi:hypothetical protein